MSATPQHVAPATPEFVRTEIRRELDRCVMCGLCLPHCPTYVHTRQEFESPRGRIALLRGVESGALEPNRALVEHLDHCLGCRACERVCPAGVRYGTLLDWSRGALRPARDRPKRWLSAIIGHALSSRLVLAALGRGARVMHRFGATRADAKARGWRRLRRLAASLDAPVRVPEYTPAQAPQRGAVALFIGCVASLADHDTVAAVLRLLPKLGYAVSIPLGQSCCGALAWHSGDHARARRLLAGNEQAFGAVDAQTVLLTATGCMAHLRDANAPSSSANPFATRACDLITFLIEENALETVQFDSLAGRILVHEPCTLAQAGGRPGAVAQLLQRIPGAAVETLPSKGRCCGAAGAYLLTEADFSEALLAPLRREINDRRPEYVVTTNIGCRLQLSTALHGIEVLHPVTLLARQWKR